MADAKKYFLFVSVPSKLGKRVMIIPSFVKAAFLPD
jgi:hypothetical protein